MRSDKIKYVVILMECLLSPFITNSHQILSPSFLNKIGTTRKLFGIGNVYLRA